MILGVSRKKTAKNKTIKVPINRKVYTKASIFYSLIKNYVFKINFLEITLEN